MTTHPATSCQGTSRYKTGSLLKPRVITWCAKKNPRPLIFEEKANPQPQDVEKQIKGLHGIELI
jgi:hypothetical protein